MESLIKVDRVKLLNDLTVKYKEHLEKLAPAIEKYRLDRIAEFTDKIERLKAGEDVENYIKTDKPYSRDSCFKDIIQTLEYSVEPHMLFTKNEFCHIKELLNLGN